MEEEDHFTQTLLPLLSHTAAQGSRAAALGSYCYSLLVLIYRQEWCHNSNSCSTMVVVKVNGWCRLFAAY